MVKKDGYSVKREIMNALVELMTQKSYMDITVTDIVTTAQVARASFYRNFDSISDVIDAIVAEMSKEFMEDVLPTVSGTDERKWREFLFQFFYRISLDNKKKMPFSPQNASVIFSRIDNRMQLLEKVLPKETIQERYAAVGKLGLINNVAKKWIQEGMKETPEEMIDYIMSFITLF